EIHDQYQLLSAVGMPFLAAAYGDPQEREDWDDSCAREKLLVRIAETQRPSRDASASPLWSPAPAHLLLEFAANPWIKGGLAACSGIAVAFGAYSISRRTHNGEKRISHSSQPLVQKLAVEKQSPAQLAELQATRISKLQEQNATQEQEVGRLRTALRGLEDRSRELAAADSKT